MDKNLDYIHQSIGNIYLLKRNFRKLSALLSLALPDGSLHISQTYFRIVEEISTILSPLPPTFLPSFSLYLV